MDVAYLRQGTGEQLLCKVWGCPVAGVGRREDAEPGWAAGGAWLSPCALGAAPARGQGTARAALNPGNVHCLGTWHSSACQPFVPGAAGGGGEREEFPVALRFWAVRWTLWGSLLEKDFKEIEKHFHCMIWFITHRYSDYLSKLLLWYCCVLLFTCSKKNYFQLSAHIQHKKPICLRVTPPKTLLMGRRGYKIIIVLDFI